MDTGRKSLLIFGLLFIILTIGIVFIEFTPIVYWKAHTSLTHSLVQSIATVIALFCGFAALYRFYSSDQRSLMLLFIGVGFIGTGIIDAYHAVVTTNWFAAAYPQIPSSIPEWSWLATRIFLSLLFVVGLLFDNPAKKSLINPTWVYISVGILVVLTLLIFLIIRTPFPEHSNDWVHRPLEIIPGFLFVVALIGYGINGQWRTSRLFFWIMMFLITNVCIQFLYIDFSAQHHDTLYIVSHILKVISYGMIYIGISDD